MEILIIIGIEMIISAGLIIAWKRYDEQLKEWEDKTIEKIRSRIRRIKRDLCAKWLAEDGMTAIPRLADNEDIIFLRK